MQRKRGQMKKKTYLAEAIETAGMKAQLDARAKKIVADKSVLSRIIKYTVDELKDYTLEEIAAAIEGIEIAAIPVYPGMVKTEAIVGMPTEDVVPNEGKVTYDIRFCVLLPKGERIKLILNIEIQKDSYPGYDLVTRAVFYCARMISAQLNTEFNDSNYDDIKKVYSIWLCLNSPKKEADTITEYHIEPRALYGSSEARQRYDLMSIVMVKLNEESWRTKETLLHGLLGTIFSKELKAEEKLNILEHDYEVEITREVKEGVNKMCNLSDAIEERGIQQGMLQGMQQGGEQKLIEQICRKVRKGKTLQVIAEELEEEESSVLKIYDMVLASAPDYDCGKIYALLHNDHE